MEGSYETDHLAELRMTAAEASGGCSSGVEHDAIMRSLERLGAKGDVLDFGAGTGTLTARLLESGRYQSVSAADLMARPPLLPSTVNWYEQDLNAPLNAPPQSFDTVVACEIIEHLENPRGTVREWSRLLRPGGLLVLSTPNNESIRSLIALLVRGHFVAFGDTSYPAHITALLRGDVQRILQEAGFIDVHVSYTNHGGIPGRPSITWQKLTADRLRGKRWSDGLIALARSGASTSSPPRTTAARVSEPRTTCGIRCSAGPAGS